MHVRALAFASRQLDPSGAARRCAAVRPRQALCALGRPTAALPISSPTPAAAAPPRPSPLTAAGDALLCVLHTDEGPAGAATHLDCLAAALPPPQAAAGSAAAAGAPACRLAAGPWCFADIEPSTAALVPLEAPPGGSGGLPRGVLALSASGAALLTLPTGADAAGPAPPPGALPRRVDVAAWRLRGPPTAAGWLAPGLLLVADAGGGLSALDLRSPGPPPYAPRRVVDGSGAPPSGPCIATTLTLLPLAAGGGGDGGGARPAALLHCGAVGTASHLRAVPPAALAAAGPDAASTPLELPLLDGRCPDGLGAVQDAVAFRVPTCPSETQLLLAAGAAPAGRLLRALAGAALRPYMVDGPELPGDVTLFPLKRRAADEHHALLAFSLGAAGATGFLDVSSSADVRPVAPSALAADAPSLLLATLPGDWLAQVTPAGLRVAGAGGEAAAAQWAAPAPVTLAAAHGGCVVLVAGGALHALEVDTASGSVAPRCAPTPLGAGAQASALAAFGAAEDGGGELLVAVGDWLDRRLRLLRCGAAGKGGAPAAPMAEEAAVALGDRQQPHSIAVARMAGGRVLGVGTLGGGVLLWRLLPAAAAAAPAGRLRLAGGAGLPVSNVAVRLLALPDPDAAAGGGGQMLYAQAGSDALLRDAAGAGSAAGGAAAAALCDAVRVSRVHGGEGLRALCGLHTPDMPRSAAWVHPTRGLLFGRLDAAHALRWAAGLVGDTPSHVAHHAGAGALVALTHDGAGGRFLRVADAGARARLPCRRAARSLGQLGAALRLGAFPRR